MAAPKQHRTPVNRPDRTHDVILLGAGASGLMCAMTAAARGRSVLLLDHAPKAGCKLSITGGGKCNLTNRRIGPEDYEGENPDFCRSAVTRFPSSRLIGLFEEAGIPLEEREHGQMFCRRSAKDAVRFFTGRCQSLGCAFRWEEKIIDVITQAAPAPQTGTTAVRYLVRTASGEYAARNLVIALGGPAWPQVGATGRGYEIARAFGHRIVPIRPALSGLIMPSGWAPGDLSGVSTAATIRVVPAGDADSSRPIAAKKGGRQAPGRNPAAAALPLLFTHRGISGPAALQASLYWRPGFSLLVDFLPQLKPECGLDAIFDAPGAGKALCRNLLRRVLPDRLCDALLPEAIGKKKAAELNRHDRDMLTALFRAHTVTPVSSEGFAKAEVTAGGVSTEDISSRTMESKRMPGLYFCGEVLDVTGRLGGYNLHWAFASGHAVGEAL